MSSYKFFKDIITKIEQLQETLNQLRGIIRRAIEENASLKTVVCEKPMPIKVSQDATE